MFNINYVLTITDSQGRTQKVFNSDLDFLLRIKNSYIRKGYKASINIRNNYQEQTARQAIRA